MPQRLSAFLFVACLSSTGFLSSARAQESADMGYPIVRSFRPHEYRAHPENWSVVTDPRGILYVANESGILEFDGVNWRLIDMPFGRKPRALAVSDSGHVFVGGIGEFGMLSPDSTGTLRYLSLLSRVPQEERGFLSIQAVHAMDDGVYFLSASRLFRWKDGDVRVWHARTPFQSSFSVRDTLYVMQWGRGILRVGQDSLSAVPGGGRFARSGLRLLLPGPGYSMLAVDDQENVFRYDGSEFRVIDGFGDVVVRRDDILCGLDLGDSFYALGTVRSGVALIGPSGRLLCLLNNASGLPYGAVRPIHRDGNGGLWLAMDNGIARVDPSTALTSFTETAGLRGSVQAIVRADGVLHAATDAGIYQLLPAAAGRPARFIQLNGIDTPAWQLLSMDGSLLAGTTAGVLSISDSIRIASPVSNTRVILQSAADSSLVLFGGSTGLSRARHAGPGGTWSQTQPLPGHSFDVRSMIEDRDGVLWLGLSPSGAARIVWPPEDSSEAQVKVFDARQYLPDALVRPILIESRPVFVSQTGLLRFDGLENRFIRDELLSDFLPRLED